MIDAGSYVCNVGNGITDWEGNVEKTATIDLIVQSKTNL